MRGIPWRSVGRRVGLVAWVLVVIAAVSVALPFVRLPWLLKGCRRRSGSAPSLGTQELSRVVRIVDRLLIRVPGLVPRKCLRRSIVLYYFAERCGVETRLHCGVMRSDDGGLSGHAWLSREGLPIYETRAPEEQYRIIYSWPLA